MNGDMAARVLGVLSAAGLLASIRAATLVPQLHVRGWAKILCYAASASIILCFGLLLLGMVWGLLADWPPRAKSAMIFGFVMAVPAVLGSAVLFFAGLGGSCAARGDFIGLGIVGIAIFAIPALVITVMAAPGRP